MQSILIFLLFFCLPAVNPVSNLDGDCPRTDAIQNDTLQPPSITCPPSVTVSCQSFDPTLWAYGEATAIDDVCPTTTITGVDNYTTFDTICLHGTISRQFTATDCEALSSQCTQQVVVNYEQDYYVRFPNDVIVTGCFDPSTLYGQPTFYGEDCELMSVSFTDEAIPTTVPTACYRLERIWHVINWCQYDPSSPLIVVPNPQPNVNAANPVNFVGPVVSACSATPANTPPQFVATTTKITPTDPAPTNFCTFYAADANGYEYRQLITVVDTDAPAITGCPSNSPLFADSTTNNPGLWHGVFNPVQPAVDVTEAPVDLSVHFNSGCVDPNVSVRFLLFLDLDGDGTRETVVGSAIPNNPGEVRYGNAGNAAYSGGTPVAFDTRAVPAIEKWRFAVERTPVDSPTTAALRWITAALPPVYTLPELPAGEHRLEWIVSDACGNESICNHNFIVEPGSAVTGLWTPTHDALALHVFPNPATEAITVSILGATAGDRYRCIITDALGRSVRRESFSGATFRLERGGLASGLYDLQVTDQMGRGARARLVLK